MAFGTSAAASTGMKAFPTLQNTLSSLNIASVYQQYKSDNTKVTNWLGRAALNAGFDLGLVPVSRGLGSDEVGGKDMQVIGGMDSHGDKDGVLMETCKSGQATKSAGKKANARVIVRGNGSTAPAAPSARCTTTSSIAATRRYKITPRQYLDIASHLASKAIPVPADVIRLLDRCIHLRQRCSNLIVVSGGQADEGHAYFWKMLEEVRRILSPLVVKVDKSRSERLPRAVDTPSVDEPTVIALSNRFADFAIDADTDTFEEDLPDIDIPAPPLSDTLIASHDVFEVEMSQEEASFRALAFFMDVDNVRNHIKAMWQDYARGEINLVTAAVTTNTALELLQRPHDDMAERLFPVFGGLGDMLLALWNQLHPYSASHTALPTTRAMKAEESEEVWAVCDQLLIHDYQAILEMIEVSNASRSCIDLCDGLFVRDSANRYTTSKAAPMQRIREGVYEIFDSLKQPTAETAWLLGVDRLYQLLDQVRRDGKPNLMAMVAVRLSVDIAEIVNRTSKSARAEMVSSMDSMLVNIDLFDQYVRFSRPREPLRRSTQTCMSMIQQKADTWARGSSFDKMRQSNSRRSGTHTRSILLEQNPVICGLALFDVRRMYQQLGFKVLDQYLTIIAAGALFCASRKGIDFPPDVTDLPDWADMRLLMMLHDLSAFEALQPRDALSQAYRAWSAYLGHDGLSTQSKIRLANDLPMSKAFTDRVRHGELDKELKAKELSDPSVIVSLYAQKMCLTDNPSNRIDLDIFQHTLEIMTARKENQGRKLRRAKTHKSAKFSILQLLSTVEYAFQYDAQSLYFDYIAHYQLCDRLLDQIFDEVAEDVIECAELDNDLECISHWVQDSKVLDRQIRDIFHHALQARSASEYTLGRMKDLKRMTGAGKMIMFQIHHVFRTFLGTGGDVQIAKILSETDPDALENEVFWDPYFGRPVDTVE